ncbi:DNA polymerase III subunit gamma/tau [Microvirga thermotolerans]|uniref:DNA polymerase III subunit gamma/tau n=1 Tax=Microvirga thermotolerans TaxID=2651334 RepID=A0A5P9K1G1_9HYPH|nr:DNA polymerase III subunit gamma/tau [Microvirga thermotolerans]QFU17425.1 DNA polymerase III subunit gamma/tau [Microvirga thermotolerans]
MDETTAGTPPNDEPALPGFPPAPAPPAQGAYRVLARKYRPRTFDDLIGQEAMVRTLSNAFETGRIPQAWMLTGVRGVGKTTTARILARGLNYQTADGGGGPTIHMPALGVHCEAIMESRHVDVLEMDAASHTGIDDVRQIIDGIRYSPVSARYKVYIIDEVHMLSEKAFNAFLKTLEEPPPHAKFIFATTEIRKVPVTILSRCQRFDLRRIDADKLVAHLARICEAEGVRAEQEALAAIARAAEGSARDSLSLLDQAIAHGAGVVKAETVRDMLGLADRTQVIDLFEAVMRGDVPAAFANLRTQYDSGADPAVVLSDLAAFSHTVTRLKLIPEAAKDPALSEAERSRGLDFARGLPVRALSRAWQILLKGIPEVQGSNRPVAAAEMVLVRLAYAADLPTPDEALRALRDGTPLPAGGPAPASPSSSSASPPTSSGNMALASSQPRPQPRPDVRSAAPAVRLRRFEDVVALAGEKREIVLKAALEREVRLVRFEEGSIELSLAEGGSRTIANDLARALQQWTGQRWMVALSTEQGAPTLHEQALAAERERREGAASHPLVQAVLAKFPGAQIVNVIERKPDEQASDAETGILGEADAMAAHETEADDDLD